MRDTDGIFAFKIGEEVTCKAMASPFVKSSHRYDDVASTVQKGVVMSRWLEECNGGTQLHYDVRWYVRNAFGETSVTGQYFRHREDELMPYPQKERKP